MDALLRDDAPPEFPEGHFDFANLPPRDIAVRFFGPMAVRLDEARGPSPGAEPVARPLTFPSFWPGLPASVRRPLERTALTLNARLARKPGEEVALVPVPGNLEAGRLATDSPARTTGFTLPGGVVPPWGAGSFRPGVALIVGERSNVARVDQLKHRLPFVTFAGGGLGPWLCRQLEASDVAEDELYWINAYDSSGAATDPAVIPSLQPRVVIALGPLAERWCLDVGTKPVTILDPRSWRNAYGPNGVRYPLGRIVRDGA